MRRRDVIALGLAVLLVAGFVAGWTSRASSGNSKVSACQGITNMYLAIIDEYGGFPLYESDGYNAAVGQLVGSMNGECENGVATPHPVATYPAFEFQSCQQAYQAMINARDHVNYLADFGTDRVNRDLIQTINAADAYHQRYCEQSR